MGFFKGLGKKIGINKVFNKVSSGAQKLFNKGEIGGQKLFGKGSIGSQALGETSHFLNSAGKIVGDVGGEISKIANNSVVQGVLGSNPIGRGILSAAAGAGAGLQGIGKVGNLAAGMTKQSNYSGDAANVVGNVLEKAQDTGNAGKMVTFK